MRRISADTSTTICPLPFLHTYITADGSRVACCEAQETKLGPSTESLRTSWNNEQYRSLRTQMLAGERPALCRKCWENEDLQIPSNRQEAWRDLASGFFGASPIEVDETGAVEALPRAIELKCNNLCNLKCRMCHPESSHRVMEDREIIDKYRKGIQWSEKVLSSRETVQDLLKEGPRLLNDLEVIQFSGGEPLISEEQYDLVSALLDHEPERRHLRYATNLTQLSYKNLNYPELWRKFGRVNIKVSIDGINDVYNYIRVGSQFEKVANNLKRLLDMDLPNLQVAVGFTTQAYNVYQLPEFLHYFGQLVHPSAITTFLLHTPRMMMISSLPFEIRERILNKFAALHLDLPHVTRVLQEAPFEEKYWRHLLNYTGEMEAKYKIEHGYLALMEKYLEGY